MLCGMGRGTVIHESGGEGVLQYLRKWEKGWLVMVGGRGGETETDTLKIPYYYGLQYYLFYFKGEYEKKEGKVGSAPRIMNNFCILF